MSRRLGFLGALLVASAAACSSDDSATGDASTDQTSGADAPKESSSDATKPPPDASADATPDATQDSSLDATQDATEDAIEDAAQDAPLDVAIDVSLDAGGCLTNSDCLSTQYCERGNGVCAGLGVCTARPQFCPLIVAHVCGCDNVTYTNSCYAHQGGVTVAYSGNCE